MSQDDTDAALHQKQMEERQMYEELKVFKIKPAYCDFIASKIKDALNAPNNSILLGCTSVKYDIDEDGQLRSTKKTIEVVDTNCKAYRITVEEL